MKAYKQLAGQTAIYGLSSILGRMLNYLLVPLYTRVFAPAEYGVVTQLYAYVAFFNILFTYGLETAFFRFFQTEKGSKSVYTTGLLSIIFSSSLFTLIIFIFSEPVSSLLLDGSSESVFYIKLFAAILACDAITAIPFARLRQENKAKRFAFIRLFNIGINVILNFFFLVVCPALEKKGLSAINLIYDPSLGVGYVFIINLITSAITVLMLLPEITGQKPVFDTALWKRMMTYAFPLMIAGFAGMINETFDRILIPLLIDNKLIAMEQLGIYGACYKLSIIMTLFIQTFRYAAEPFFFSHSTKENPQHVYAQVMKYFVIVCSFIFLGVMLYIDLVKYFIGSDYRSGLGVVPILLLANLFLGVFYNLSIWYKLTAKTQWGAWLSVFGAVITLLFNFWLIPVLGYMGAAWATFICYGLMMLASYLIGQKNYPVPYDIRSFFTYLAMAVVFWLTAMFIQNYFSLNEGATLLVNTIILLLFVVLTWRIERGKINYLRQ